MRLDKALADLGIGTRKEIRELVRGGAVTADGAVVTDPGAGITEWTVLALYGRELQRRKNLYYMLNKPAGTVCATADRKLQTVIDLLPADLPGRKDLFPVGRLDRDTEGLLLLTNDGVFAHRMISPRKQVNKVYLTLAEGPVTEQTVRAFREGIDLPPMTPREDTGYRTLPGELRVLSAGEYETYRARYDLPAEEGGLTPVLVTIREGKFHQVKRMFHVCGAEVRYLMRLRTGGIELDPALARGNCRELTQEELDRAFLSE
ncbi:MAG: rRNA pseudouridine synthase [Lachnospiraceae bacterium]|nr:rRNA pseudouridine synthase [Lachnospiraceae bacterium]